MKASWRWFGEMDPIKLEEIKQTGATEIVTALHEIPCGERWEYSSIKNLQKTILENGLKWRVVESLPISEEIKQQSGSWKKSLDIYIESLENLARCQIETVCYNFMPITDWTRTDVNYPSADRSRTLYFNYLHYVMFDVYLLQREQAKNDYDEETLEKAYHHYQSLTQAKKDEIAQTIGLGLPGTVDNLSTQTLKNRLKGYHSIDETKLQNNHKDFLEQVIPHAERLGIKLAVHPDDPPFPLFGLPRIVSTQAHLKKIFSTIPSQFNGLTLCAGSLGSHPGNDVLAITKQFSERIHFVHLRNTESHQKNFKETPHLEGDTDMISLIQLLLEIEQTRKKQGNPNWELPFRPDHGHLILNDLNELSDRKKRSFYPGYSLLGRMKGLAELRGVIKTLDQQMKTI